MKFLFLSQGAHLVWDPASPRAAGGAEFQAALMARELVRRGHEAVLLGADTGQPDGAIWQGIRIRSGGRYDTGGMVDTLGAWPKIHRALREENPDFVVVYGWTSLLYALALWRRVVPFRLVFVCALDAEIDGGFRRRNPVRGLLFHRGMQASDFRFGITARQAAAFEEQGMRCHVTRLLLPEAQPTSATGKPVDLLWVARCEEVKRPMLFLDLAETLPDARCRMICSAQDQALWERVKERAGRIANVEFIGGVAYRDIQSHFDGSKILVNTSSHEGVPNTFIHAARGGAAIASLEIDPDGMFGTFRAGVLAHGDMNTLIDGVRLLLGEDAMREAAAVESARFVREWHDNARNVTAFLRGVEAAS
ncbi:MAG: glycosyltransferase family 4 protein [Chthoniobacterales bacterium]|nr:glycosyltransferase family 4 protein [Chthoniobacterales bacterium]